MNSAAPSASPAAVELSAAPDRAAAAERAAQLFEESFGYQPDGVWSAPGRVNIIGEHVDYQDGLCLPMAISHRCFAAAARTPTNRLRLRSVQDETVLDIDARTLSPETVTGWPAYVAGVLWALGSRISGASTRGMDILIDGQVPLGAGLSSSAALECSAAEAIEDLLSLGTEPLDRVRAAITAETDFAGASTGGLDQSASVLSREGHALFLDCRDFSTRPVPWDLASQGLALLITDTRAEHPLLPEYHESSAAAAKSIVLLEQPYQSEQQEQRNLRDESDRLPDASPLLFDTGNQYVFLNLQFQSLLKQKREYYDHAPLSFPWRLSLCLP